MKTRFILSASLLVVSAIGMAGPGDGDLLQILKGEGSRSALNLAPDTLRQMDSLFGEMESKINDLLSKAVPSIKVGGFSLGKPVSPDSLVRKLQSEFRGQFAKMLNPEQVAQAFKMGVQAEGNFAFLMPEVEKQIKIDKSAKKAIEGHRDDYLKFAKELALQVKEGKLTDEERKAKLLEKDGVLQSFIAAVVKPDQLEALKMLGS